MAAAESKLNDLLSTDEKKDNFDVPKRNDNDVRLRYKVIVIYFGDVNSTQQTFKCRLECWVRRELTNKEIEKYKLSALDFEPNTMCEPHPVGCSEIIECEAMRFNNNKTFMVTDDDIFKELTLSQLYCINCIWTEILELENFPFDVQHFEMVLQFRNDIIIKDNDWINFNIIEELCGFAVVRNYFNIVGWDLKAIELPIGNKLRWEREKGFILILKRHWIFYIYRVVIIMFIVGVTTLSVFRFDEYENNTDNVSDRMGFISTMLLTVVAYMFIIKEYLPLLNYLTLLDLYVYFVLLFILIIAMQCILSSFLETNIDLLFFIIDSVLWFAVHLIFFFYSRYKNQKENEKIDTPKYLQDEPIPNRILSLNVAHPQRYDKRKMYKKNKTQNDHCLSYFMFAD